MWLTIALVTFLLATITPSLLINDIRNKAGSVVFSKWKQTHVARAHVIPANPQTDGQVHVRTILAYLVTAYQLLSSEFKDFLKVLASGLNMSGFNVWTKCNATADAHRSGTPPVADINSFRGTVIPPNEYYAQPSAFVTTPGANSKEIHLAWDNAGWTAEDHVHLLARKCTINGSDFITAAEGWAYRGTGGAIHMNAGSLDLEMPEGNTQYQIALMATDLVNWGPAAVDNCLSHAA